MPFVRVFLSFETSAGIVKGELFKGKFYPTDAGIAVLKSLYVIEDDLQDGLQVDAAGWIKIPLSDPFYGSPEYRLTF